MTSAIPVRCSRLPTELWSLVGSRSGAISIYTRYVKRMTWSQVYMIKIIWVNCGFIAQSVEHRTDIAPVSWVRIALEPQNFFLRFICKPLLSYFTTAKISFTSILDPHFTRVMFTIYTSRHNKACYYIKKEEHKGNLAQCYQFNLHGSILSRGGQSVMLCSKCCYSCFFREASVSPPSPPSEFLPDIFLTLASRVTAHKVVFLVSGQANQTSCIGLLDSCW